jgi:hypothetical protein
LLQDVNLLKLAALGCWQRKLFLRGESMSSGRITALVVLALMVGCSSEKDDDSGQNGSNPFPTTDVSLGDGVGTSDAGGDVWSSDASNVDAVQGLDVAPSDAAGPAVDILNDAATAADSNVSDASAGELVESDSSGGDDTGSGPLPGQGGDQLCGGADPWTGKGVPFKGLEYTAPTNKAYNFTCTSCPGGIAGFEGSYRYISEKWDIKPDTPQTFQAADIDTLQFEGNWFTISRRDLNTGKIDTASGYYFCPDPNELGFAKIGYFNTVWYFDSIQGSTMFNTTPGTVNPVHVGGSLDVLEMQGAPNWDSNSGGICPGPDCLEYCRIGSTVDGIPCKAPW